MSGLWFPVPGGTFLHPLPSTSETHLRVILHVSDGLALIAPVCTLRAHHRPEIAHCVLNPGDHPFIRHPSFVDFSWTQPVETALLAQWVAQGRARHKPGLPDHVFRFVLEEAKHSRAMPARFRDMLR